MSVNAMIRLVVVVFVFGAWLYAVGQLDRALAERAAVEDEVAETTASLACDLRYARGTRAYLDCLALER